MYVAMHGWAILLLFHLTHRANHTGQPANFIIVSRHCIIIRDIHCRDVDQELHTMNRVNRIASLSLLTAVLCAACTVVGATTATPTYLGRGVTLGEVTYTEAQMVKIFDDLSADKANVVRIGVTVTNKNANGVYSMTQDNITRINNIIAASDTTHLRTVMVLSFYPTGPSSIFFNNPASRASVVNTWKQIATQVKGKGSLVWFDLINEPVPPSNMPANVTWKALATDIGNAIRSVDSTRALVIEPAPWGTAESFANFGAPLAFNNTVYSFHFYTPHLLTHQGIDNPIGTAYPSALVNNADLLKSLAIPATWAKTYKTDPLYVGEFSCIRWAPGSSALNYIKDATAYFETQGWSWTYHSYLEFDGWDSQISPTVPQNYPTPWTKRSQTMDRWQFLLSMFKKN